MSLSTAPRRALVPADALGRTSALVAAGVVVVAASVVLGLGLSGSRWVLPVGALAAGAPTALWGALLLRAGWGDPSRRHQQLMATAGLVWGVAQVAYGLQGVAGLESPAWLAATDLLSAATTPLAVAAVLAAARAAAGTTRRGPLAMEGLIVGSAVAVLLWLGLFQPLVEGAQPPSAAVVVVWTVSVLAVPVIVGLGSLVAVTSLDTALLVAAGGGLLLGVGELAVVLSLAGPDSPRPWPAVLVLGVAWPLVLWAYARTGRWVFQPRLLRSSDAVLRSGIVTAASLLVAVTAVVLVTAGAGGGHLDATSGAFLCLLVTLCAARELMLRGERRHLVADLQHQLLTDDLTGLPNRRALLEHHQDDGALGTVVVKLGLDSFYEVNDQFGHAAGDGMLRAVAAGLREQLRDGWTVHRVGGDEFVLAGPGRASDGRAVATAALRSVRRTTTPSGQPLSACAGVAAGAGASPDPASLLSDATAALRRAKGAGWGGTAVFDTGVAERGRREHQLAVALGEALAADRVVAYLQPVVDVASGQTRGVELLSRWRDDELGQVSPDEFVPVAERTGLVRELGRAVLRHGLAAFGSAGGVERGLRCAVNASATELRWPGYADQLRAVALESGVPLDLLTVEVTESLFLAADDPAVGMLRELAAAGVQVAIDDFGTGYSSLSYLERLPVTTVKIDRSLVVAAAAGERSRAMLAAVVAVSHTMGLQVVAEGVELPEQARVVHDLGIRLGQGWLWSRALAPHDVAAHLAAPVRPLGAPAVTPHA